MGRLKDIKVKLIADKDVRQKRLSNCLACPMLGKHRKTCTACGCLLSAKIALTRSKCPIGKWEQ